MEKSGPIGVFDSGVGGLTVLEKIVKDYPGEDYIYVADHGHCPYGIKSPEEIEARVVEVGRYLISRGVKAIVIACNTASLFKDALMKLTSIPIISVIEPTAIHAINSSVTKKIAVLATNATIKKGTYQNILTSLGVKPFPVSCSEFVDIVEEGKINTAFAKKTVAEKLTPLLGQNIDTVIHGCTHFGLLENEMKNIMPDVQYIDCGGPTSDALSKVLPLKQDKTKGKIEIWTTGEVQMFSDRTGWFKLPHEQVKKI